MSKSWLNKFISIILVFILVGAVAAGIVLIRQTQEFREKAAPSTSLAISPSQVSKLPGEDFEFSALMTTGDNQVTGFDVEINFNPSVVEIISISAGSAITPLDQQIKNSFDNSAGTISFSKFTLDRTKAVTGSNLEVLTVVAKVKDGATVGSSLISYGGVTAISAVTEGQNVLTSTVPGTVEVIAFVPATETPIITEPVPTDVVVNPTDTLNEPDGVGGGQEDILPTVEPTLEPTTEPTTEPTAEPTSGDTTNDTTGTGGTTDNNSSSSSSSNSSTSSSSNTSGKKGDLNGDGKVSIADLSILLSNFNKNTGSSDLNGDGKITILDLSVLLSNWGK